jgi:hypothetical protein
MSGNPFNNVFGGFGGGGPPFGGMPDFFGGGRPGGRRGGMPGGRGPPGPFGMFPEGHLPFCPNSPMGDMPGMMPGSGGPFGMMPGMGGFNDDSQCSNSECECNDVAPMFGGGEVVHRVGAVVVLAVLLVAWAV